jgi:hypothetical protein
MENERVHLFIESWWWGLVVELLMWNGGGRRVKGREII